MELQRLAIKLFAKDATSVRPRDFVPVFHGWIQRQAVSGHQLIDVHDYSHIHNGPGILLVAHEGNFCTDMAEGRFGLAYNRKQGTETTTPASLATSLRIALSAAAMIEEEPTLKGRITFRTDEFLIAANDRLLAPNDPNGLESVRSTVSSVLEPLLGKCTLTAASSNPKERLAVRIQTADRRDLKALLSHLTSPR